MKDKRTFVSLSRAVFAMAVLLTLSLLLPSGSTAKTYVDITTPGISKLPIALQHFIGGREVSDIVNDDLSFTGLFECIPDSAQIEGPDQAFNPGNWKGLGVAFVVKGRVVPPMTVVVTAYDATDGKEVLRKEYSASKDLLRPVAHTIANELYRILTGQQGVFRTRLAYVGDKEGRKELYLSDWDGNRSVGIGIRGGILLSPRWANDGSKLIYSAERAREWGIFLLDMNSMKEKNLVALKGLNMVGNFFPGNREFLFTSSKDGNMDIFVGDIVTSKGTKLVSSPWIDVSPAVSPGGDQILFVSNRGGNPQIYAADRNGQGIRRITYQGSYNTGPAWSPKGDKIAFSGMVGGRHQVFVINRDGSGLTQLTDRGNNEEPSFSPDGRYIAFSSDREGGKAIFIMRVSGEGQKRVSPRGIKATSPSWSPL